MCKFTLRIILPKQHPHSHVQINAEDNPPLVDNPPLGEDNPPLVDNPPPPQEEDYPQRELAHSREGVAVKCILHYPQNVLEGLTKQQGYDAMDGLTDVRVRARSLSFCHCRSRLHHTYPVHRQAYLCLQSTHQHPQQTRMALAV
jgi:hypothetical protein